MGVCDSYSACSCLSCETFYVWCAARTHNAAHVCTTHTPTQHTQAHPHTGEGTRVGLSCVCVSACPVCPDGAPSILRTGSIDRSKECRERASLPSFAE
eukprot:5915873-Prymnesium_polylepis.1